MFRLKINNKEFKHFKNLQVSLNYNGIGSTFSFSAVFDTKSETHLELFRPLKYNRVKIYKDDELVLTGVILNNTFSSKPTKQPTTFSGYSITGVLGDCEIPVEAYPLQSNNRTLKEITEHILSSFYFDLVIDDIVLKDANTAYDKSVADNNQTAASYITNLCNQKDIVLSHTVKGELLFTRAKFLVPKRIKYLSADLAVTGQGMHDRIMIQRQSSIKGGNAGEFLIHNPYVDEIRPKTKQQTSGTDNDTELACKKAFAEELKNIKLTVIVDNWNTKPNTMILIKDIELYLFNDTKFFVESVTYSSTKDKQISTLSCVIPEVYNGETPKNIFK